MATYLSTILYYKSPKKHISVLLTIKATDVYTEELKKCSRSCKKDIINEGIKRDLATSNLDEVSGMGTSLTIAALFGICQRLNDCGNLTAKCIWISSCELTMAYGLYFIPCIVIAIFRSLRNVQS